MPHLTGAWYTEGVVPCSSTSASRSQGPSCQASTHPLQSSKEHVARCYIPGFHMAPSLLVDSGPVSLFPSSQSRSFTRAPQFGQLGFTKEEKAGTQEEKVIFVILTMSHSQQEPDDVPHVREIVLSLLGQGSKPCLFAYTVELYPTYTCH